MVANSEKFEARQFVVVTADHRAKGGFDNLPGAEAAAVAFGDGAHVIDTKSGPYQPAVQVVEYGQLVLVGHGVFDRHSGLNGNLLEASRRGILAAVIAFLARGADVNAVDTGGGSALMWAVARGDRKIFHILMDAGADPDLVDKTGLTPRLLAAKRHLTDLLDRIEA